MPRGFAAVLDVMWVLRITRILRVLRLATLVPELWLLIQAIVRSVRTLLLGMLLLLLVVYIIAVLCTRLIGQAHHLREDAWIQKHFGNLGHSAFTLITLVTLEDWPEFGWNLMRDDMLDLVVPSPSPCLCWGQTSCC